MFRCNTCIRRTLRTLLGDVLLERSYHYQPFLTTTPTTPPPPPPSSRSSWHRQRRRQQGQTSYYTTTATVTTTTATAAASTPIPVASRVEGIPSTIDAGRTKEPEPIYKQADLERELRWLRDPLKLGDRVVSLLREDLYFKALALVRLASRDLLCTVSWNHLIDWDMSKGKVVSAVKLYNEVRGNAIVLRLPMGLAYAYLRCRILYANATFLYR